MSQGIWTSINPTQTSGLMLAGLLDDFKAAIMSGFAGTSRPSNLQAGGMWVDTTFQVAPNYYWSFKFYTGVDDVEVFRISILNGFGGTLLADGTFTIRHDGDDAVGSILSMVKNRIANNGQVLSGDTVGEIRFTGRTNASGDPVCAYIRWVATDDMAAGESGGSWAFSAVPDATASIAEHFRFLNGIFETVKGHKVNSARPVSQNVATTASIVAFDTSKVIAEMTGATATAIHGLDATGPSGLITIHNRSSAVVTIKHQSATASAANRMKLPKATDIPMAPDESITLFYCLAETRWKVVAQTKVSGRSRTLETIRGVWQQYVAPSSRLIITTYRDSGWRCWPDARSFGLKFIDPYGNLYAFGDNTHGQIGDGTVAVKSSPVAVLGGLTWGKGNYISNSSSTEATQLALSKNGSIYAWGSYNNGKTGLNDTTPRSSPVALMGGLFKWAAVVANMNHGWGLTETNDLYAWGTQGAAGVLGVGDLTLRSSPTIVFGGLKVARMCAPEVDNSVGNHLITTDGDAYGWGFNAAGQVGDGTILRRSSPCLVLGGLKWKKIVGRYSGGGNSGTTVGITSTGDLYAWGFASSVGGGGWGDSVSRSSPVALMGGVAPWKDVIPFPGSQISFFAIDANDDLYAWGLNDEGQLGVGDVLPRSTPTLVLGGLKWKQVSCNNSGSRVHGITTDGVLYGWGNNASGSLAVASDSLARSSPVAVVGGGVWEHIDSSNTPFGIKNDGLLYIWGINANSMPTAVSSSPVAVVGGVQPAPNLPNGRYEFSDLTQGATYDVVLSQGRSTFGGRFIGFNVDYITIQYDS